MDATDPIEALIDRQLSSLWMESIYMIRRRGSWGRSVESDRSLTNYIEDMFIEAIDRANHWKGYRRAKVADLATSGYTQEEISLMVGISVRTVRRDVQQLREDLEDG